MKNITKAPVLFHGGPIYTQDESQPKAGAILVQGDHIVEIHTEPDPSESKLPDGCRRVDLRGRALVPGFCDAHIHFIDWGFRLDEIDLTPAKSAEQAADIVAKTARERPDAPALIGAGWSHNAWPGGALPNSPHLLDAAEVDRPVVLHSKCLHLAWLNSAALRAAAIDASTPDPPFGKIGRKPDGSPNGILYEEAILLAERAIPPRTPEGHDAALARATKEAHRQGITSIHVVETMSDLAAFRRAALADTLRVRTAFFIPLGSFDELLAGEISEPLGPDGVSSPFLHIAGLKVFADGSLGGRTSWMKEPFENEPGNTGIPLMERDQWFDIVTRCTEKRTAIAAHGIGDAAIEMLLDGYEHGRSIEAEKFPGQPPIPHRIEHFQTPQHSDIARAARLMVGASMQPSHLATDWEPADRFLGDARAQLTYPFRSMFDAGVPIAFGSDAPVERVDVGLNFQTAVNRLDFEGNPAGGWRTSEAATIAETLRAYNRGGAEIIGRGDTMGFLAAGMPADFVILNSDPFTMPREELMTLAPEETWVAGEQVFSV